jgi:hypothetical protein
VVSWRFRGRTRLFHGEVLAMMEGGGGKLIEGASTIHTSRMVHLLDSDAIHMGTAAIDILA